MTIRTYSPEIGQDINQGLSNLGSLFGPPSAQNLVAQSSIAKNQADTAAQAQARSNIQAGNGSAADYATLGVAEPAVQSGIADLYSYAKLHPGLPPSAFDTQEYVLRGKAGDTFAGVQSQPLSEGQSRILPAGNAAQMGVPQVQHGTIKLGDDDQMLPGGGAQPIVSAPGDDNAAPDTTDALAARVGWDAYQRAKAQTPGGGNPGAAPVGAPSVVPLIIGSTNPSGAASTPSVGTPPSASTGTATSPPSGQDALLQALFGASMARLGKGAAPQTTIDMKGEGAEAAETGKMAATRENDLLTAADKAPENISRLQLLSNVLAKTRTGPLAGPTGTAVSVANSLGIGPDRLAQLGIDPNQAVNNETAQKLSNELVAGSIGAKGGGFPASNFSVAERQFIEKMYPSISSQPGSNQFVSDVLQAREQRTLQKAQDFATYRNSQQQAGKPVSFNDFDAGWQAQHANENVFQPVIDRYNAGGYSPAGAMPPQPGGAVPPTQQSSIASGPGGSSAAAATRSAGPFPSGPTMGSAAGGMPTLTDPSQVARLPSGTQFRTPDGRIKVAP